MQYYTNNADGSVAVVTLLPDKVISDTGLEIQIMGQRRNDEKNECSIYGSTIEEEPQGIGIVVGDKDFNIADLKEDSLPGFKIVFPDIKGEIDKWIVRPGEEVLSHHPIERHEIPSDRYFRGAWTHQQDKIIVHMDRAREIHRNMLRAKREPLLNKLDVDYVRADEQGNHKLKAEIAGKKQTLRDITKHPDIEKAKTPEELKAAATDIISLG